MPLMRYFIFVGGALLALLFIADACLPALPVVKASRSDTDLSVIRIHSDTKWPERVVFDTSVPTIIPALIAGGEPSVLPPETGGDVAVKAREREAFAQMQPSDTKQAKSRKPQHKSRIARKYTPSHYTSAPQWQLGWYGQGLWRGG